jgi:hypothetical protein
MSFKSNSEMNAFMKEGRKEWMKESHNECNSHLSGAFSPDIAPFDFGLFARLETALIGDEFGDESELLDGAMRMFDPLSRNELETVFEESLVRLDTSIQRGGGYVE